MASPGEFTVRAYLAGKLDLAQAEAVGDLVAASSQAAHALASNQMRGGYSAVSTALRDRLLHLTALLELELDFAEEEVEFADRRELRQTMRDIAREIDRLRDSFALGNAIKEGVLVAIAGAPNVGKSTLLNRLLGEERAMVSEIAGTTRDVIEECANIGGVLFRFLDTAGIRTTDDHLERMGIERTMASIRRARIVIRLTDATARNRRSNSRCGRIRRCSGSSTNSTYAPTHRCPKARSASRPETAKASTASAGRYAERWTLRRSTTATPSYRTAATTRRSPKPAKPSPAPSKGSTRACRPTC